MSNEWETRTTVDVSGVQEYLDRERSSRYIENIEAGQKAQALTWLLENKIGPAIEGLEFYQGNVLSWTCGYEFQIPLNSLKEVDTWYERLIQAGWESADKEDMQNQERVNRGYGQKGNYLKFRFRPGDEIMKELSERFDYTFSYVREKDYQGEDRPRTFEFSRWMVDLHLEFYPTEESDCKITNLGTVKVEQERTVWEVTCAEGAAEMEALLNGGANAESE